MHLPFPPPQSFLGEEQRPDTREWQKSSLHYRMTPEKKCFTGAVSILILFIKITKLLLGQLFSSKYFLAFVTIRNQQLYLKVKIYSSSLLIKR